MALPKPGRSSVFPAIPTDGQVFVDSEFVRWVYNSKIFLWERGGTVDSIPLATNEEYGYMSRQDKKALDSIPAVGGGFGIIVDPKQLLSTDTNPDGVIQGPIELRSESLDIICVGTTRQKSEECADQTVFCAAPTEDPPGLLFKPKDLWLDTLIIDLPGPTGDRGETGYKGLQGEHGFSDGPQGQQGEQGTSIGVLCELTGISYRDISGIAEDAIVDLKLMDNDGHGCKLISTKAKLDIPEDRPADKVLALPLSRSLVYPEDPDVAVCDVTRLDGWTLVQPRGDETTLDLQLLRLAKGSNDRDGEPVGFNGTMSLSDFVTDIVEEYKKRLTKIDEAWGKQVKEYIEEIDDKARRILSDLAHELAMCEFNLPAMEYCITFTNPCSPTSPSIASDARAIVGNREVSRFTMGAREWRTRA